MINVKETLLKNNTEFGTYALVTYNDKTEPIWFTKHNFGDGDWFLESPCQLYEVMEVVEPVDKFATEYVADLLEEGVDVEDYINKYVKPMIVNGILYSIENFQCSPYLPKEVDNIELISERQCLEYMLKQIKMGKSLNSHAMGQRKHMIKAFELAVKALKIQID